MSQVYTVPLDTEWSSVTFDHEFLSVLRARNLEIEIEQLYTVGTLRHGSDDNSSYLLAKVSHLTDPLDEVDVVDAERDESLVCGCPGWFNHCYDNQVGAKIDDCKHTKRLKQKEGRDVDQDQATLLP